MDDTVVWVLVVVGVVLIAALVAWAVYRNMHSRRLRERFGPEYDRTVERTSGDRRQAESVLGERVARREDVELKPLSAAAREDYRRQWAQVQAEFVDQPDAAAESAQRLLDDLMAERGYPVGESFEERADLISVDHPDVVDRYRIAHRLHRASGETGDAVASTEDRRQALVNYRALFAELLDSAGDDEDAPAAGVGDEWSREPERRTI